jgi:uncharacterized protein DUF1549/uncharacterized protein DUF1553
MRPAWLKLSVILLGSVLWVSGASSDCSFLNNPDEFTLHGEQRQKTHSDLANRLQISLFAGSDASASFATLDPVSIQRKNFIDDSIFARMGTAGIRSAPIASDAEFLRRVTLDLTGRIPSGAEVDAFVGDTDPSKRDLKVDALIGSPEFIDKWTMFLGDLLRVNAQSQSINRAIPGRDAFYLYIKDAITTNKPYDQMAREMIGASGDSFAQGETNWSLGNTVAMGPAQDTYDGHAVNMASMFLGIQAVDCLLCHDGARHLDTVNLWGSKQVRANMWGLSAYFARVRRTAQTVSTTPLLIKYIVSEAATGEYQLNTTTGNRSARQPINGVAIVAPNNPFSPTTGTGIATGENRRQALARQITGDIQFSRAIVNYVWEKFMVEAFVSPSNAFDLARLDPNNPPPSPWTLQPTNPQLLQNMALWFQANRYDLRALMSLIAKSNAYQLSATYSDKWDVSYVPYYARKYVRRLDAEEIHDGIAKATGILGNYTLTGSDLPPVQWAMQFPDTREPRSNGAVLTFLNAFGRGDRDTTFRRSDPSTLQALNMLNNAFVEGRIHQANQGSRVQTLLSQGASAQTIIRELFMNTLSRPPSDAEVSLFLPMFQQQGNRLAAEGLQWTLLNKMDFIFNY